MVARSQTLYCLPRDLLALSANVYPQTTDTATNMIVKTDAINLMGKGNNIRYLNV
jgi:hypothetical protein